MPGNMYLAKTRLRRLGRDNKHEPESFEAAMAPEITGRPYPLYSTTFTVHRLSPLFHNNITLDSAALRQYAFQFRDVLTGEVLRGVRVGLAADEDALARVGALKNVQWSLLKNEEDWEPGVDESQMDGNDTKIQERGHAGIMVEINYEKSTYSALLLHDAAKHGQNEIAGFSHYPLLLTRMPGPLRETFLNFLAATFDTRASVLKLPSHFLVDTAEEYLKNITSGENGPLDAEPATRILRAIIKEIVVMLTFDVPSMTSSLKAMEFTIPKDHIWRFTKCGQLLLQVDGTQKEGYKVPRPCTRALTHYADAILGLNLDNPQLKISRVACGAFVLGTEGKIKLSAPPAIPDEDDVQSKATKALLASLIDLATGGKAVTMVDLT